MIVIEKNLTVNQNIKDVFHRLYEDNDEIFNKHMRLIEWKKDDWKIKKKLKQRKEFIYIYLDAMPDEVVKYTTENDRYLRLETKNQIIIDTPVCQKIKTKFKILNVNPFIKTILNDLRVVNIKNKIELKQVSENVTTVKVIIKVALMIPKTRVVDNFITALANDLTESAVAILG